jgi:hypothetical protein
MIIRNVEVYQLNYRRKHGPNQGGNQEEDMVNVRHDGRLRTDPLQRVEDIDPFRATECVALYSGVYHLFQITTSLTPLALSLNFGKGASHHQRQIVYLSFSLEPSLFLHTS